MAHLIVPEWTRATGWRQGHVLLPGTASTLNLRHHESPNDTCVIVVSHDCDIAQANLEFEPHIEVIIGRRIPNIDSRYTLTKNPRLLHVELKQGDTIVVVELDASKKRSLEKRQLAQCVPDTDYTLPAANLPTLKKWLAIRYNRAAFPNEFEDRLSRFGLREKIGDAVRPTNEVVSAIYIELNTFEEISSDDPTPYELTIFLLYQSGKNALKAADVAEKAAARILSGFEKACKFEATNSWQHLKLKDCIAISEDDAPISRFKDLPCWRLDHWSFKPKVVSAQPPTFDT